MENENRDLIEYQGASSSIPSTVDAARVQKQIEGQIILARKFPRDIDKAYAAIIKECGRPSLAKVAVYSYPRGGKTISGPSIRLAEVIARHWGNLDSGLRELSRDDEMSRIEAYSWDMESNTRWSTVFDVPHIRDTKDGGKKLTDSRDIYENNANMGSRRQRACILKNIPGDIVDAAVEACEATISGNIGLDLETFRRKMLAAFQKVGITQEMIEKRLNHKYAEINKEECVEYNKILLSVSEGTTKREDWFKFAEKTTTPDQETETLNKKLLEKRKAREALKGELTDADKALIEAEEAKQAGAEI